MNASFSTNRNVGIDLLKYLCAFLVICLHSDFYGKTYVDTIARIAVPLFFMITGYYYTILKENNKIFSQMKKIFILMLTTNLFYTVIDVIRSKKSYAPFCNFTAFFRFLLLNERPIWSHLWYLGALLYGLLLIYISDKLSLRKKMYFFIPILLCINLILGNYSTVIFGHALPIAYSRNFLFMALPFLLLGDCLYQFRSKLKTKNSFLFLALILSVIFTFAEQGLLLHFNAYDNRDFFLGTTLTVVSIFLLTLQNSHLFSSSFSLKISCLGKYLSLGIYILHPLIIYLIGTLLNPLKNKCPVIITVYFYSAPFINLLITTFISSFLITRIKRTKKHP